MAEDLLQIASNLNVASRSRTAFNGESIGWILRWHDQSTCRSPLEREQPSLEKRDPWGDFPS